MKRDIVLIPTIFLMIISIIFLPQTYQLKQIMWLFCGLIIYFIVKKIKYRHLVILGPIMYIIANLFLVLCLVIGKYNNGARAWIDLGFISFQPSEVMKISLILMCEYLVLKKSKAWFLFILMFIIPSILTFLEPDTGAIIIYLLIFLAYITYFLDKKKIVLLSSLLLVSLGIFVGLYLFNQKLFINILGTSMFYRIDRIVAFKNNSNLQVQNALISIATGKLLYFPEYTNDFIFAYIVGQQPIMFFIIIVLYFILLILLLRNKSRVGLCLFYIFFFQIGWNIGMNLNIIPVIGIPIPFLSYGGSHIITSYFMLSLSNKKLGKP